MTPSRFVPAVAIAALLVVAACSAPSTTSDGGEPAQMEHIHGIGVDPKDGTVYAGTHYGLFRIADGKAHLVADRVQDFMGFTVVGKNHFVASGHPGEGQGGPTSVGLIESDDAGRTWATVSLAGKSDFHALEYRHKRVYGLNSMTGQLLISRDMKTWNELSRSPIADFAVSPDDPDTLITTTEQGLTQTTDGGRTFDVLKSAPLMVFVGWGSDGTLAGATPEGTIYTATEPTGEWTERGTIGGQPEALTVESAQKIYAAANGAVLVSADGGKTFDDLVSK